MTAHPPDSLFSDSAASAKAPRRTVGKAGKSAVKKPRAAKKPARPSGPSFERERHLISLGLTRIAGVDEAGRGPLAGPVTAAVVILDPENIPDGLNDSKALSSDDRERLFVDILAWAHVASASASATEIDRFNIRGATLIAMRRAVSALNHCPDHILVDGRDVPPGCPCLGSAVVGGDASSVSIAAASIVAKVMRDRLMRRACRAFPGYGFSQHMGYGTAAHLAALDQFGPAAIHRMTFAPLKARLRLL
ncbi:ribonuclease HII [Jiella marina]|uniref:ribonuclease HII n=1 Tax=Jiella sp. LLJ827 TaxID=2917712 RepID=UPI00210105F1|nr:ribonuclease HII [Jiella sp. LLJ827]MCQ0989222.1 ribonuclease HII [Jiella sp. LLJ827]